VTDRRALAAANQSTHAMIFGRVGPPVRHRACGLHGLVVRWAVRVAKLGRCNTSGVTVTKI
jgi:hypothetical protein